MCQYLLSAWCWDVFVLSGRSWWGGGGCQSQLGYETKWGFSRREVFAYKYTQPLLYYNVIMLQAPLRDKIVYDGNQREHNARLGAGWQQARSNCLLTCIRRGINTGFCDIFDWYSDSSIKNNLGKLSECMYLNGWVINYLAKAVFAERGEFRSETLGLCSVFHNYLISPSQISKVELMVFLSSMENGRITLWGSWNSLCVLSTSLARYHNTDFPLCEEKRTFLSRTISASTLCLSLSVGRTNACISFTIWALFYSDPFLTIHTRAL